MQIITRFILNFLTKEFFLSIFNRQGTIASGGGGKMGRRAKSHPAGDEKIVVLAFPKQNFP
jgi:hypothetical protein